MGTEHGHTGMWGRTRSHRYVRTEHGYTDMWDRTGSHRYEGTQHGHTDVWGQNMVAQKVFGPAFTGKLITKAPVSHCIDLERIPSFRAEPPDPWQSALQ